MADKDAVSQSIGCLGAVFPQFVAKEMSILVDQLVATAQSITDPVEALATVNIDDLLDDVADLSDGDVFDNLGAVGLGVTQYLAKRELEEMFADMTVESFLEEYASSSVAKFYQKGNALVVGGMMMFSMYQDMPYAAAQKMCEVMINLLDIKLANLNCLQRHVIQLSNCMLTLTENVRNYKDSTFEDVERAFSYLTEAEAELSLSQRIVSGGVVFDSNAFTRAQGAMANAQSALTPDKDGTSILDAVGILTSGSVASGQVDLSNQALGRIAIPQLQRFVELEVNAVAAQINMINSTIRSLGALVDQFAGANNASRARGMRSNLIRVIQQRISDLKSRLSAAIQNGGLRSTSAEMLLWSSRSKSIIAMMNRAAELTLEVGTTGGDDQLFALSNAFQELLTDLTALENDSTVRGIESYDTLLTQVNGLVAGSKRLQDEISKDQLSADAAAAFHALVAVSAARQDSAIAASIQLASQQRVICQQYLDETGDLGTRERYDTLVEATRQMGFDRGVDLLTSGKFTDFMEDGIESLSYLGLAINCLNDAINASDNTQTRQNLADIRDELIGKQVNQQVAAAESDGVIGRMTDNIKAAITVLQKQGTTIENILEEFKKIGEELEVDYDAAIEAASGLDDNLDRLAVQAGGRLAADLEELGPYPGLGVPVCTPS